MIARALIKYIRMSPRKVRYVIQPLRQKTVAEALIILSVTNRRAVGPIEKAIRSAFANARQKDATLAEEQVVIDRIFADGGPTWKRFRAAAFGRAVPILKRTSHLTVELERINGHHPAPQAPAVERQQESPSAKPKRGGAGRTRRAGQRPKTSSKAAGRARKPKPAKRKTAAKG